MGWITTEHPTVAELDACVQCGLCLPFCPTFRLTGDETASPRGRLTAMAVVAAGEAPIDEVFDDMMGFCLQCRACEAVCPSLVPFGRAMEGARAELAAQRPTTGRWLRRLVTGRLLASRPLLRILSVALALAVRLRLDRLGGPFAKLAGLRPMSISPPSTAGQTWDATAPARGTVALLSGCVMDPWFGPVHDATVQVLRRAGFRVEVPATQTCCGALAAHEGAPVETRRLAGANVAAFAGYDRVVVDAAGCGAHLMDYGHWHPQGAELASRVVDVNVMVAELLASGHLPTLPPGRGRVAVQDPCHLRHAQRVVDEPRAVLRAAGYDPLEIDPQAICCGAAGMYTVVRAETSEELGRRKADQVRAAGAAIVASANPGCEMQLRAHLGRAVRVAHPVELYWEAIRAVGEEMEP